MNRRSQENIFACILFVLFLTMLVLSFEFGPRARLVPVPIAILCMVLIVIQVAMQNMRATKDLTIDALELIAGKSTKSAKEKTREAQRKAQQSTRKDESQSAWKRFCHTEFAALGVILILLVLFLTIGPIPAVFFFCTAYFFLSGYWPPIRSFANGVICTAVLYITFGAILGVQLNRGMLSPHIAKIIDF